MATRTEPANLDQQVCTHLEVSIDKTRQENSTLVTRLLLMSQAIIDTEQLNGSLRRRLKRSQPRPQAGKPSPAKVAMRQQLQLPPYSGGRGDKRKMVLQQTAPKSAAVAAARITSPPRVGVGQHSVLKMRTPPASLAHLRQTNPAQLRETPAPQMPARVVPGSSQVVHTRLPPQSSSNPPPQVRQASTTAWQQRQPPEIRAVTTAAAPSSTVRYSHGTVAQPPPHGSGSSITVVPNNRGTVSQLTIRASAVGTAQHKIITTRTPVSCAVTRIVTPATVRVNAAPITATVVPRQPVVATAAAAKSSVTAEAFKAFAKAVGPSINREYRLQATGGAAMNQAAMAKELMRRWGLLSEAERRQFLA